MPLLKQALEPTVAMLKTRKNGNKKRNKRKKKKQIRMDRKAIPKMGLHWTYEVWTSHFCFTIYYCAELNTDDRKRFHYFDNLDIDIHRNQQTIIYQKYHFD